ncbi:nuclease-related domain-containing protein [Aquihabitans sp. McL0605]|uniref:nuclease-related domain-containing protein n=1 Tax=Aquihabitans sp. McL0605 TaxID=3415671 RepID=UPI003CF63DDF
MAIEPGSPQLPATKRMAGATAEDEPPTLDDELRGIAGAGARAERQRRSRLREQRVRARHPKVGGFLLAVTDDPTSTKVWDQGAIGEEKVGAHLEQARPQGIEVLHDRRMPGSRANIDHLVAAPTGIWVIDAKRYLGGKLERRDVGGWFNTDVRIYVGGRDQTKLIAGVSKQIDAVARALSGAAFESVPVRGVLCFVDVQTGWSAKPFAIDGVTVTWRKHLLAPMLDVRNDAGGSPGPLDEAQRAALARHLAVAFPSG